MAVMIVVTGIDTIKADAASEDIYVELDDKSITYGAWLDDGSGMNHNIIYEGGIPSGSERTGTLNSYVSKGLARFTMYVDFNLSQYLYGKIANAESVKFDIVPMCYRDESWKEYAYITAGGNASNTVFTNPRGEMLMGIWYKPIDNTSEPIHEEFGNINVTSYSNRETRFANYSHETMNLSGLDLTQIRFYMSLWVDDILKTSTYVSYRLNGIKIKVTITYEDGSEFQETYVANTLGDISSGIHDINNNLGDISTGIHDINNNLGDLSDNQQTIIDQNQTIINQGNTIVTPDKADKESTGDFQTEVQDKGQQSDQLLEDSKVEKPDVSDDVLNPMDKVDDDALDNMGGMIGAIFVSPTLGSIALLTLIFGLLGYILYGKRG